MKSKPLHFIIIAAALSLFTLTLRADEASYAAVVKERDAVLSQILAGRESRRASGIYDEEAIASAQIALYSFRRDVAPATADKIKNQDLIVQIFAKKLEAVKARRKTGVISDTDVLEANALLLEAKQLSEELRLKK